MTTADPRLREILPAIAHALGVPLDDVPDWSLPPATSSVVVLVDGLGELLLRDHADSAPFLSSCQGVVGVCDIPSTTATSLTSLGTALSPSKHGVVGYTARIPGTQRLLNALDWDEGVDAEQWQPYPTAFEKLANAGIATSVIGPPAFATSGLTRASQRGAQYLGATTVGERLAWAVRTTSQRPAVTYVYDGDLDRMGHLHGTDSLRWRAQLRSIDANLEHLRALLPDSVRLVVTADHGMVNPRTRFDLDSVAGLRRDVTLIGGEARFRHLYCRRGTADAVAARWRETLGEHQAIVRTFAEAQQAGWFGEVRDDVRERIGDVVVASLDDFAVMSSVDFPQERQLVGMHGSITNDERLIPIRWC